MIARYTDVTIKESSIVSTIEIADAMAHAPSNDYWCGGEPWIVFCPEHAAILSQAGYSKTDVKRRLWELSLMRASRMADKDYETIQHVLAT